MSNRGLTSVHKILKDVNFDNENTMSSDIRCTICNGILINAHFGLCGCRYCFECITAYLDGEDQYCPGNTADCQIELLNIDNNIHIDHPMNIKISRLIVKCPSRQCDEKIEVRNLEDHIRVCKWRPTNCPFFNVGCRDVQMANDAIEQHLLSDNHAHTKLLMDCIDILRNDFGEMKEEMRELRDELKGKQLVIDELRAVITQQSREIDRLGEDMVAVGNVNRELTAKVNGLSTKIARREMDDLEVKNKEEKQMGTIAQVTDKVEQMELKGSNTDARIGGLEERVMAITTHQIQLNYGEFVWTIDNFSDKRKKAQNGIETQIFSESFYSHKNRYKMCLSAYPDGVGDGKGTHLSVFIHLMRGPFDDILEWPFKCEATVAIVNQQLRLNYMSYILKYDNLPNSESWKKPLRERNKGYGDHQFITFDQLLSDVELYNNDQIFIKCVVRKS